MNSGSAVPNCAVVIPNINGLPYLLECLDSVSKQTRSATVILVDNNSSDDSVAAARKALPGILVIQQSRNYGFTGGVNPGMQWAIDNKMQYVALLNNDAVANKSWLEQLTVYMDRHQNTGIAASKITDIKGTRLDSTGEFYTSWGLPFARGRGEPDTNQYDHLTEISAASGGASIYRVSMLKEVGLFDQDFFAYYEDVDISLRAQLAGWQIGYVPQAIVRHHIGNTSKRIKGFTTYQTIKNLPWVAIKNLPSKLFWAVAPKLMLAHALFFWKAVIKHNAWPALKGLVVCMALIPKKIWQRIQIQKKAKSPQKIASVLYYDLPPDAHNLRKVRKFLFKLTGKKAS